MPFKLNFLSFIGFPILISLAIYLAVTSSSSQVYYSSTVYASPFSNIVNFTLNLVPDFHNFTFIGSVTLGINVTLTNFKTFKRIYLDMNDQTINNISISNGKNEIFPPPKFTITGVTDNPEVELDLGKKLTIEIPTNFFQNCSDDTPSCRSITLVINFTTSSNRNGRGINWLAPNQTFSGKYPFFYTFCKPYRCRTLAPMMDSLGMSANMVISVTVPSPMSVYISAQQFNVNNSVDVSNITTNFSPVANLDYTKWTLYVYNISGCTPSLLNIAIGVIEARDLGGGFTLLAEPEIIDNCSSSLTKFSDYSVAAQNITILPVSGLNIMVMPMGYIESISLGSYLMFVPFAKVLNTEAAKSCVWEIVFSSFFGVSKTPYSWSDWYIIRGLTRFLNYMARRQENPEWALLYNNVTAEVLDSFFDQLCSKIETCFLTELSPNLNGENENNFDYLLVPEYKGFFFMLFLRDRLNKLNNTSGDDNFMSFTIQIMNNSNITSLQTLNDGNSGEFFTLFVQQVIALTNGKDSVITRKQIHWIDWWYSKKWDKVNRPPMNASSLKQKADDLADIYLNGSQPSANKIADFSTWYPDAKMSFLLRINNNKWINETLIKLLDATYLFSSSNDCFLMQTILESKIKTYSYSIGANVNEILRNFVELAKKCGSRYALELEFELLKTYNKINNATVIQTVFDNIKGYIHPLIKEKFQKSLSNNTTTITHRSVEEISAKAKISQFLMK